MSLQYFDHLWSQANTDLDKQKANWDARAEEFNSYRNTKGEERISKLFDFFAKKDISLESLDILDIGCGAGQFSIEFAKKAKQVIGLDISTKMIAYANENAEREGSTNTQFYALPWEDIKLTEWGWQKKFDLVIANMTPAVNSRHSLEKMIDASRGACFMSGFVDRDEKVKREIEQNILQQNPNNEGHRKAIYYSFNILWLHGIYPEIFYHNMVHENDRTVEEAFLYYCCQLESKNSLTDKDKENIRKYLEKIAINGRVQDIFKSKTAWLFWQN